jgi:hypothetical protein
MKTSSRSTQPKVREVRCLALRSKRHTPREYCDYALAMDALSSIDPAHCPGCLSTCVPAGTTSHLYWVCPVCKAAVLAGG